jgi:hypothetical protein
MQVESKTSEGSEESKSLVCLANVKMKSSLRIKSSKSYKSSQADTVGNQLLFHLQLHAQFRNHFKKT